MDNQQAPENTLVLVSSKGIIRTLFAPFPVTVTEPVGNFQKGTRVYVEAVLASTEDRLLFMVYSKPYPYRHFIVVIRY